MQVCFNSNISRLLFSGRNIFSAGRFALRVRRASVLRVRERIIPGFFLALLLLICSCSRDECLENKTTLPQIAFFDSAYPDQKVTLDSTAIYAEGVPGGKLLLDSLKTASSLTLPFNLESGHTDYIFEYLRKDLRRLNLRDTLHISYSLTPYFVSSACGVSYRILIEDLTSTHFLIDSVATPQALITNQKKTNIIVYFRVSHPEQEIPEEEQEEEQPL